MLRSNRCVHVTLIQKLFVLVIVLIVNSVGCNKPRNVENRPSPAPFQHPKPQTAKPDVPAEQLEQTVQALNRFSLELYGESAPSSGNYSVSPIGSFLLLEVLSQGATGQAQAELSALLPGPSDLMGPAALLWHLNDDRSLTLGLRFFLDNSIEVKESFRTSLPAAFESPITLLPFQETERAKTEIQQWVKEKVGTNSFRVDPKSGTLLLLSTLRFDGEWSEPFEPKETKKESFILADGSAISVPMMRQQSFRFSYFQTSLYQGAALPYTSDLELLLLLPQKGSHLNEVLDSLLRTELPQRETDPNLLVTVELPPFEINQADFDLTEAWQKLGLQSLTTQCHLEGMLETSTSFKLQIMQGTNLKVDELGTKAQAITVSHMTPAAAMAPVFEPRFRKVRFDRPFAFVLRHTRTGAFLLLGKIENPQGGDS